MLGKYKLFLIVLFAVILVTYLAAIMIESWLISKQGRSERSARLITVLRARNKGFRRFQYPYFIATVIILAAAMTGQSFWFYAVSYIAGALICLFSVIAGGRSYVAGTVSAANFAYQGDIQAACRASQRTGAVSGLLSSGGALLVIAFAFMLSFNGKLSQIACYLAVCAATVAVYLCTGGTIYSNSYSMASRDNDHSDRCGFFFAVGADQITAILFSIAATTMLADVAVATSGITSTFTSISAVRYPIVVAAAGTGISIPVMFIYRASNKLRPARSANVVCMVTALITAAIAFYFSNRMLQSVVYGFAVVSGMIAALLTSELARSFSYGSKLHVGYPKSVKSLGKNTKLIFSMGTGMISVAIDAVIIIAVVSVSYNFASIYGIALCAVGAISYSAAVSSVRGLSVVTGSVAEILNTDFAEERRDEIADTMYNASVQTGISSDAYSYTEFVFACFALIAAITFKSGIDLLNIATMKNCTALLLGILSTSLLCGLIILAVRTASAVALRTMRHTADDDSTSLPIGIALPATVAVLLPFIVGFTLGINSLVCFDIGACMSGFVLVCAVSKSGEYLDKTSAKSLGSLIMMMVAVTAAFFPMFIRLGGFIF